MTTLNGADSTTLLKDKVYCKDCDRCKDDYCEKFKIKTTPRAYCEVTRHPEHSSRLETTYCFECQHGNEEGEFFYCDLRKCYKNRYNYCYGNYRKE